MVAQNVQAQLARHDKIESARAMDPIEKLFAGADLFAYACEITLMGICSENPSMSEAEARVELEATTGDSRQAGVAMITPRQIAMKVVNALEQLHVPYMFVGSFSSNFYGIPRSTKDADLVIELGATKINAVMESLGSEFRLEQQMTFETVSVTTRYRVTYPSEDFLIELFLLRDEPFDQSRFSRRIRKTSGDVSAYVASPEDVIVMKLRWAKGGRRQKDIDDVLDVLEVQTSAKLDLTYIRHWCDQHGTRELLEQLLKEAEPPTS